jgi:hypothetical protein
MFNQTLGGALAPRLFVWLISHQLTVLFSQNKPAINQQYFSLRTNQHQPSATSQTNRPPLATPLGGTEGGKSKPQDTVRQY